MYGRSLSHPWATIHYQACTSDVRRSLTGKIDGCIGNVLSCCKTLQWDCPGECLLHRLWCTSCQRSQILKQNPSSWGTMACYNGPLFTQSSHAFCFSHTTRCYWVDPDLRAPLYSKMSGQCIYETLNINVYYSMTFWYYLFNLKVLPTAAFADPACAYTCKVYI